jgi:trans-aconitate 2-methyltransferase
MTWNPKRYLTFADQRTRPAIDLLGRVPLAAPARVVDLGCGPGNSTALLVERWPTAQMIGLDASTDMLAKAKASGVGATWVEADIATWAPTDRFDLIYSNAALQWLGDHADLLPRLLGQLTEGGVLAVQMPRNFDQPSHVLMRELAAERRFTARLAGVLRAEPVATPAWYYDLLAPMTALLDIWESEYLHVLEGDDPVLRWVRGTALRPVIEALDASEMSAFETAYRERLRTAYPKRPDGRTLLPFRRLFMIARR